MNKINLVDYIHCDDLIEYDDYLKYLYCDNCNMLMIQPTFCSLCGINGKMTCFDCKCLHETKKPRHICCLIDKIRFKCQYCNRADLHYNDLIQHKDTFHKENETLMLDSDSNDIKNFVLKETITIDDCNKFYLFAKDILNEIDILKNNQLIEINNAITDEIKKQMESVTKKYNNIQLLIKTLSKDNLNSTKNEKDLPVELILKPINEYETIINNKHIELDNQIASLTNQLKSLVEDNSTLNNNKTNGQRSLEYHQLLIENDWLQHYIITQLSTNQSLYLSCSLCGNTQTFELLFKCLKCQCYYCLNKCAYKCKGFNCTDYLCPKDSIKCSLCNSKCYCDKCLIKCFYEQCANTFCIECYSINEHQKRNNDESCNLIQCELCSNDMCIMTSLNCTKCGARLCITCFQKHLH